MARITRFKLALILSGCTLIAALLYATVKIAPSHIVASHQRAITLELAEWEELYGNIETHDDALLAAEMIEHIKRYYPVGQGYRGTKDSEVELEIQRKRTIETLASALEEHTGKSFGDDHEKWLDYLNGNSDSQ